MLDKTQTITRQILSLIKELEGCYIDEQNQLKEEIDGFEVTRSKINDIKKIIDVSMITDPITLNIGGTIFQTSKATLTRIKGTYFDIMLSGEANIKPMTGAPNTFFIDRDGSNFKYILNYLRDGDINVIPKCEEVKSEVEREMKFYKIDLHIPPSSPSTLIELSHFELVDNWIGSKQNYTLLYKGSRDGLDATSFHKHCDEKGKSITLIKSSDGNVFGGYNSQDWDSNGQTCGDPKCFLFTIINKQGLKPTKYPAIDLPSNHDDSFPSTYTDTTGLGSRTFTGDDTFIVEDIEVFEVTTN
ncbi:hypothetical protein DFA_06997 [Cavenderia fasciculata]|uniref:TLDc domain-containing protein n=1 Tax=Cavenderia fasciculata TaxID=261658 RepID=F4PX90_CACFS|nr:uncharacterized protein DFA_06997 [Cavenderia fasciculata]EGG19893.1 hypothetical protein DFA_06997 [Cavenderia fasciculata]|eukprot:XP_004366876.1 hypothetical protein DFA_06997 [Cavenderia fasciculata]